MHSGSLESSNPLCVVRDGVEPMFLQRNRFALSMGGLPPIMVGDPTPVELTVGCVIVSFGQHTEGRGKSGNAMLNLCLWSAKNCGPVDGWLAVADSEDPGEAFSGKPIPS